VLTGLGVLPLLTLGLNTLLRGILTLPSHMLLYLIAVMLVGLIGGLLPALAAALAAAALLGYYFIAPVDVVAIESPENVVALVAFSSRPRSARLVRAIRVAHAGQPIWPPGA
jgi:two-component system sensor histidine kinase KdpD